MEVISGIYKETDGFEGAHIHRKAVVSSLRCLEQPTSHILSVYLKGFMLLEIELRY